jgi:hypothetical protein
LSAQLEGLEEHLMKFRRQSMRAICTPEEADFFASNYTQHYFNLAGGIKVPPSADLFYEGDAVKKFTKIPGSLGKVTPLPRPEYSQLALDFVFPAPKVLFFY